MDNYASTKSWYRSKFNRCHLTIRISRQHIVLEVFDYTTGCSVRFGFYIGSIVRNYSCGATIREWTFVRSITTAVMCILILFCNCISHSWVHSIVSSWIICLRTSLVIPLYSEVVMWLKISYICLSLIEHLFYFAISIILTFPSYDASISWGRLCGSRFVNSVKLGSVLSVCTILASRVQFCILEKPGSQFHLCPNWYGDIHHFEAQGSIAYTRALGLSYIERWQKPCYL